MRFDNENEAVNTVTWMALLALVSIGSMICFGASAQDFHPLKQPDPAPSEERLKIGYLATVQRGHQVKLILMSGRTVTGAVRSVKKDSGVIVMRLSDPDRWGHYKAAAVAGVEFR